MLTLPRSYQAVCGTMSFTFVAVFLILAHSLHWLSHPWSTTPIDQYYWQPVLGLACALCLQLGNRLLPFLFITYLSLWLVPYLATQTSIARQIGIDAVYYALFFSTYTAIVCTLLRRFIKRPPDYSNFFDVIRFILIAGLLTPAIMSLIHMQLRFPGLADIRHSWFSQYLNLWLTDAAGLLILIPLSFLWQTVSLTDHLKNSVMYNVRVLAETLSVLLLTGSILTVAAMQLKSIPEVIFIALLIPLLWIQVRSNLAITLTTLLLLYLFASSILGPLLDDQETLHVKLNLTALTAMMLLVGAMIEGLKRKNAKLVHVMEHDQITQLPNRIRFLDTLRYQLRVCSHTTLKNAVILIDIRQFKEVNQVYGHEFGDKTLKQLSLRVSQAFSGQAFLARLGEDEFALAPRPFEDARHLEQLTQAVKESFERALHIDHFDVHLHVDIGVSVSQKKDDADSLLKQAYKAIDLARANATASTVFYDQDIRARLEKKAHMTTELKKAMERGELTVRYQPIVDSQSGQPSEVEALLRWQHPELGFVSPAVFIPLAEESGAIIPIGYWMMDKAIAQASRWKSLGDKTVSLAINLSEKQLLHPDLVPTLLRILRRYRFPSHRLVVEITEKLLSEHIEMSLPNLRLLSTNGIRIAMDDFGVGSASLSYLKRLPLDTLKIDQSFVRNLPDNQDDCIMVKAMIQMANSLGMKTVAEGVETFEQARWLSDNHCDSQQGYLFSRPVPDRDFQAWLIDHQKNQAARQQPELKQSV